MRNGGTSPRRRLLSFLDGGGPEVRDSSKRRRPATAWSFLSRPGVSHRQERRPGRGRSPGGKQRAGSEDLDGGSRQGFGGYDYPGRLSSAYVHSRRPVVSLLLRSTTRSSDAGSPCVGNEPIRTRSDTPLEQRGHSGGAPVVSPIHGGLRKDPQAGVLQPPGLHPRG